MKIFLSLITVLFTLTNYSESATIHTILVGNTIDCTKSCSMESSIDMMQRHSRRIAAYTNSNFEIATFEHLHTFQNNVMQYIDQMDVAPDDVILAYFVMHGTRTKGKTSKWPDLNFPFEKPTDLQLFIDKIKSKQPKLSIIIAESCNPFPQDLPIPFDDDDENGSDVYAFCRQGPTSYDLITPQQLESDYCIFEPEDKIIEKFMKLFTEPKGTVVATSCSPGQSAWRKISGGVFTEYFCDTLSEYPRERGEFPLPVEDVCWESFLNTVAKKTTQNVQAEKRFVQTPQYEIDLE